MGPNGVGAQEEIARDVLDGVSAGDLLQNLALTL
jgi:hypothetical protein